MIAEFVDRCGALGLDGRDLNLQVVIATGEFLAPDIRTMIGDFFSCRVVNEYGCTESGILAFGCEEGEMHLVPVATWIETIDEETQLPVQGRPGPVVLTDLMGPKGPFVRFRLGDRITIHPPAGCGCGRDLPTVEVDIGRQKSFILLPDGKKVNDAVLAYSVPPGIRRFRGRQRNPATLEVDVVVHPGTDPGETTGQYRDALQAALGPGLAISVTVVESIPREASGKLRYFIPLESA